MGYKVAVAEQMEDPKQAKGIVKRDVVQVITPGTCMSNDERVSNGKNNYLTAVQPLASGEFSFAYTDLATGELKTTLLEDEEALLNEACSLETKEMVLGGELSEDIKEKLFARLNLVFSTQEEITQMSEFSFLTQELTDEWMIEVTMKLLSYLAKTQMRSMNHLQQAQSYQTSHFLKLDYFSKYNLELTQSIRTGKKHGTLLWLLDETKTAMGGRLLKQWIDRPLISASRIHARQNMVASLYDNYFERHDLQEALKGVYDLERLAGRVSFGTANARDFLQLKNSLLQIPIIRAIIDNINEGQWSDLLLGLDECPELVELIEQAIDEEAPMSITEGRVIKTGYNEQLDHYKEAMKNGNRWILELEEAERKRTGIRTLRIDYNRKDGYYIHVTNSNLAQIPTDGRYYRKSTLKNAERYGTEELEKLQSTILEATEKSMQLEYDLFLEIRAFVAKFITRLQSSAKTVAALDVFQSFASVAESYQYTRPQLETSGKHMHITDGRHPVVEKVLGRQEYIPNSIQMNKDTQMLLITGPNMSGKSTYMRQLALSVIMAQIGSFVPARSAQLPIFDQIFTRIGASDDLISGQSTFMVEMMEANQALRHATSQSLILFDELGRGTATYDGMALAQAIIEYIHENVHAKTLFSTHYHELTELEQRLTGLKNIHVGAIEKNGEVIFLHKIMEGPADKSYGIHVAKIAGMPTELLQRAASILEHLENTAPTAKEMDTPKVLENEQLSLFNEVPLADLGVVDTLRKLNLLEMTPMDALNTLYELQKRL
jgi:DNA mismatch repair protein MutS